MKKHIIVGASLLLTIGTAVASTFMYGNDSAQPTSEANLSSQPTPQMIAMWKANAVSTDYVAPKAPI